MTTVISTDRAAAVELLCKGEIVALPTETVYGLAADALNPIAVAKIFEAKERPRFDPLIVHLPSPDWLEKIVNVPEQNRQLISKLADKFWPGPFTIVLPKREIVPEIATAGLDTVAVRISAHPVFAEIVRMFGKPLAAPSANRFGRVSATTAQHVLDELGGRIPLVIDAGPTQYGLESTIVRVGGNSIDTLRRGPITTEQLSQFAKVNIVASPARKILAPGQLPSHYAPRTPLRVVENAESFSPPKNQRVGLLAWYPVSGKEDLQSAQRRTGDGRSLKFVAVRNLSAHQDLREAAANLFRYLRELDVLGLDLIVAERVPSQGLGAAILDRLERASHD
ncbi:MAG: threonylcarbamoyl-AMP synthase [Verrucomicrobia bacterium]|nr:MAG: threonylcarbamoyl-AMP synthase [Verrucomicrobiota bacterium]PYJ33815.1 MAG: threonylcarbamoyl-AMP synthase [Verrucomicrobiota bacterium]